SSRAATLTPSPKMSPSSTTMSPMLMPMRNSMRLSGGTPVLRPGHLALNVDGTAQRIDNTAEFDEQPVAGGFDEPAPVLGDCGIEELAAQPSETSEGAALVGADQPRIARHIGREDRREAAGLAHSGSPTRLRASLNAARISGLANGAEVI